MQYSFCSRSQVRALVALAIMAVALPLRAHADAVRAPENCATSIATRVSATHDNYHGTAVEDPYRWLENWSDPAVQAWSEAQSACARRYLDTRPQSPGLRARLTQLLSTARGITHSSLRFRGGRLFALRYSGQSQQPALIWFSNAASAIDPVQVVDLMRFDPGGQTSIDWYVPSPDGQRVAVSMSSAGSERGTLRIFDASNGKPLGDAPIGNVNNATAGGDLAWSADGSGFFYTRYPRPGEQPEDQLAFHQQIYYHRIGTDPANDRYELGRDLPSIAAIRLRMQPESGRVIAWVQKGDSGEFRFFLRETDGRWRAFGGFGDGHFEATFGRGDDIYVGTTAGAPRGKVVRLSTADLDFARARTVIPESSASLSHSFYSKDSPNLAFVGERLLLLYQTGGPTELRIFSADGGRLAGPELAVDSDVSSVTALDGDAIAFAVGSFVAPKHWQRFDLRTQVAAQILPNPQGPKPWSDVTVVREFARSRDGTRIPVTVLQLRGVKTRGMLLTGYGGYRISVTPHFEPEVRVLLEQGIAYAVANLRGGAEFGEEWHRQGSLTNKQNVFDDFIAVAGYLVDRGYAPRGKLAITGTSNGGLLMGAVLTQRPALAQAVVSRVGVYDSLRNELDANGVFNIPEFGTVADERQFRALLAYSPYHNVREARYPPVLMLTGANDSRVNPMHSRKMLARLQAANRTRAQLLLRTSSGTGHGAGTPLAAQIEELTDAYAFIMDSLGIPLQTQK